MNKALLVGLIALVLAALIGGFMTVGGPSYARLEKQDGKRAADLDVLYRFLQCRSAKMDLPLKVDEKGYCPESAPFDLSDPATGAPYLYRRVSNTHFEICATFVTDAQKSATGYPYRQFTFNGQVGCWAGSVLP